MHFSFAQNEKLISGEIICDNNKISGIQITNLVSEKSTISNVDGQFSITVTANDMLVFTSINYQYKRMFIEQNDIDSNNFIIKLIKKIEQLDEVVVNKSLELDAVKLGILDKPAKEYTPAERRLKTAGDFKPIHLLGLLGGSMQLDPIINAISGRTKKLKNLIEIERKEKLLLKIKALYNENYYHKKLKINADLLTAFQYYIVDDADFIATLKSKNKNKIGFKILELAQRFNQIQKKQ